MTFFKGKEKDMIFYEYRMEDHIFPYIDQDMILPLFPESVHKDKQTHSFEFSTEQVLEGILYFLTVKELEPYKAIAKKIREENPTILKTLLQGLIDKEEYIKSYGIIMGMEQCFGKEDMEVMEYKTILIRLLWNQVDEDTWRTLEKEYEATLYSLYDKTKEGKYAYYIGELYEHQHAYLKAKLIYKKAMEQDIAEDVAQLIRERLEEIEDEAQEEKINYYMEAGAYEDALKEIEKAGLNFHRQIQKTQCLWMLYGPSVAVEELQRYEQQISLSEDEKTILNQTMEYIQNHS